MNHDAVFYDTDGPGEDDGFPWVFAPEDSSFAERFATRDEAQDFADEWVAERPSRVAQAREVWTAAKAEYEASLVNPEAKT